MPNEIAIGLFRTLGTAQDVRARLVQEGVPEGDIELRRLAKDAVLPPQVTPQTMISFMDWLFGRDLPERYGIHVKNGETAVSVRGRNSAELEMALAVMRLFAPLHIERIAPLETPSAQKRAAKPATR
jgi:hypothetical protein